MVKDRELEYMPNVDYDKKDLPMAVGTVYSDINSFKLALGTHALKHEFYYNIERVIQEGIGPTAVAGKRAVSGEFMPLL